MGSRTQNETPTASYKLIVSVDARYKLLSLLGEGGMGTVYLAEQIPVVGKGIQQSRKVALKFLDLKAAMARVSAKERANYREEMLGRFVKEGKLGFELNHPNLIRALDFGVDVDDNPFLVSEYVEGARPLSSLRDSARYACLVEGRNRSSDGKRALYTVVPWTPLLTLGTQIADVLAYMHAQGVVHRDMKGDNVLFTGNGREAVAHVLDLGIAKELSEQEGKKQLTADGRLVGTLCYMAPEQIGAIEDAAKKPWKVGPWTDVYSFGYMMYELLTGHGCYTLKEGETEWKYIEYIRTIAPTPVEQYVENAHPALEFLLMRCLSKNPWDRPTMSEVRDELATLLKQPSQIPEPRISLRTITRTSDPESPTMASVPPPPKVPEIEEPVVSSRNSVAQPAPRSRFVQLFAVLCVALGLGCAALWGWMHTADVPARGLVFPAASAEANGKPSAEIPTVATKAIVVIPVASAAPSVTAKPSAAPTVSAPPKPSDPPNPQASDPSEQRLAKVYANGLSAYADSLAGSDPRNWKRTEVYMRSVLSDSRFANLPKALLVEGECLIRLGRPEDARPYLERYLALPGTSSSQLSAEARRQLGL